MKIRINTPKILVNALFFLIALLFSAIGLRVGFDESSVKIVFQIGVMAGLFSLAFFSLGIVVSFISKKKKGNPTKIRKRFTDSFNFAEEHPNVFIKRLQLKNLIFAFYYCLVCVVSSLFFICVSRYNDDTKEQKSFDFKNETYFSSNDIILYNNFDKKRTGIKSIRESKIKIKMEIMKKPINFLIL